MKSKEQLIRETISQLTVQVYVLNELIKELEASLK